MKKAFSVFLILCLLFPGIALADTIREHVNAPERVTGAWYSGTGKTVIQVDARVIVPDVEVLHTYAIAGRDATYADVRAMAQAAAPETDWERDWIRFDDANQRWTGSRDEEARYESGLYLTRTLNFKWYPFSDGSPDYSPYVKGHLELQDEYATVDSRCMFEKSAAGEKRLMSCVRYNYDFGVNHPFYPCYADSLRARKAEGETAISGQSMTWEEALAMADAFAGQIDENLALYCCGPASGEIVQYNASTKKSSQKAADHDAYWFCYTRVVDGVQVTHTSQALVYGSDMEYIIAPDYETLSFTIDGSRIVGAYWNAPARVGERLLENAQLLPFDSIMDVFGVICPLTIQARENDFTNNGWTIYEIRLGYMPVLNKNATGVWELRPVWDFFGIRDYGSDPAGPLDSALTIDAIDGTIIDRKYGY